MSENNLREVYTAQRGELWRKPMNDDRSGKSSISRLSNNFYPVVIKLLVLDYEFAHAIFYIYSYVYSLFIFVYYLLFVFLFILFTKVMGVM